MANMSYCRFENTLRDLRDCERALEDGEELSESERRARDELISLCASIANDYTDENGDLRVGDERRAS
jgi:hypothetical protein